MQITYIFDVNTSHECVSSEVVLALFCDAVSDTLVSLFYDPLTLMNDERDITPFVAYRLKLRRCVPKCEKIINCIKNIVYTCSLHLLLNVNK